MGVLDWGKPPQAQPHEEWAAYEADGAPPGTYQPNMDDAWKERWKAKLLGQRSDELRVEIRKSTSVSRAGSVQVKIIVFEDGSVLMSMNGTASLSADDFTSMYLAVGEARLAMSAWRKEHPLPQAQEVK